MCSLSGGLGYGAVLFRFLVIQCVADRGVYREFSVLEGLEEVRRGLVSAILLMRSGSGEVIKKMSGRVVGACRIKQVLNGHV